MIEFGKTLREAREAKGYSISQLAETTHILPQILENLEKEDFTKIVAPIYGRGFVKLCCETLGIDPKPLVDEFMAIYSGSRPPTIRMRETPAAEKPVQTVQAESLIVSDAAADEVIAPSVAADEPPPAPPQSTFFEQSPSFFQQEQAPAQALEDADTPAPAAYESTPKIHRDYRLPGYSIAEVPKRYWRFAILLVAAIIIITLIVIGTRALYRATMGVEANQPSEEVATEALPKAETEKPKVKDEKTKAKTTDTKSAPKGVKKSAPRKSIKVPSLYID